jgi:hypothetical protein
MAAAADLLRLYGWPRAVPFDVARWTVVLNVNAGVLVTACPARVPYADPKPPAGLHPRGLDHACRAARWPGSAERVKQRPSPFELPPGRGAWCGAGVLDCA